MKSQFGRYWFLKKFLVVFLTNNPKLAERSAKVVYKHFPSFEYSTPNEVLEFGKNLLHEELNLKETPLNNNLIIPKNYHGESLITKEWDSMYKANNNLQNKFFLEEGIVSKKENEYYLTGNLMLFFGLISPKVMLKNIFSKIIPN